MLNHVLSGSSLKQSEFCKVVPPSVKLYSESAKMIILNMPFHKQVLNLKSSKTIKKYHVNIVTIFQQIIS